MALRRKFIYNGINLPDPDPGMHPDDVRKMYSAQYPELTKAAIIYNDPKDGVQEYGFTESQKSATSSSGSSIEFKPSIGRKG